jgi:steroid delta-isomerase-like uncharacterized protein
MSAEANKALVQRHLGELMSEKRLELIEELFSPDLVFNGRPFGHEGMRGLASRLHTAYPDIRYTIDDLLIAEGDQVVCRWTWRGIHLGTDSVNGIPPTGKEVTAVGMSIFRVVDGRIAQVWACLDQLAIVRQLGGTVHPLT